MQEGTNLPIEEVVKQTTRQTSTGTKVHGSVPIDTTVVSQVASIKGQQGRSAVA